MKSAHANSWRSWSEWEHRVIRELYPSLGACALEKILDRSEETIRVQAQRIGVRFIRPKAPRDRAGRPVDMASTEVLAARRPHGHKMRYMAGCRCRRCRAGNAAYEAKMAADRKLYGPNDLVDAEPVRKHVKWLQTFGMGPKTIAKSVQYGKTGLREILYYGKNLIRRRAANRILALRPSLDTLPGSEVVPAKDTVAKIRQMVRWGMPQSLITHDALGNVSGGLQIYAVKGRKRVVMVRTAIRIRDYFAHVERMRAAWLAHGHTIPPRQFVYWKPGCHGFTVRSLELRPFARGYDYHYLYPPDLKEAIQAANLLKRATRARKQSIGRTDGKEHDPRSTQPPFRSPGKTERRRQTDGSGTRRGDREGGTHNHRERQSGSEVFGGNGPGQCDGIYGTPAETGEAVAACEQWRERPQGLIAAT